jgi:hypothetical protein
MTTFAKSQTPFGRPAFSWTLATSLNEANNFAYFPSIFNNQYILSKQ